jgi:hypothetical protein
MRGRTRCKRGSGTALELDLELDQALTFHIVRFWFLSFVL